MIIAPERRVHIGPGLQYRIYPLGDIHLGKKSCHEKLLDHTIQEIAKDKHALWIGMGDYADLVLFDDKRFDPTVVAPRFRDMYYEGNIGSDMRRHLAERLAPIRSKCLGLLEGNHEFTYNRSNDQSFARELAHDLGAPFLGFVCFIDVIFEGTPNQRFRICATHGTSGATTKGGKLNALVKFMHSFEADIYLYGHVHDIIDTRIQPVRLAKGNKGLAHRDRLGVVTGSYMRTYTLNVTDYQERKLYDPIPLGTPCIEIRPATRQMGVIK